jgi:N-acetylglucosamine-6-phosphate deacetylase
VICDGHHLPPAVVKCILRVKSPARTVLTCDASSLAGLPPGRYDEWGQQLEVMAGGKVVVPGTPFLAGSGVFTDTCIGIAMRDAGVSLRDAFDMAGARPRSLLGLESFPLAPRSPADLVLFDWEPNSPIRVTGTVIAGEMFSEVPG